MLTSRCGTDFHWSIFLCLCLNHLLYEGWSIVHWLPRCKHTLTVGGLNQTSGQGSSADVTQQLRDTLFTLITVGESWRTVTVQTLSQNYWVFSRFSSDVFVCWCWFCTAVSSVTCSADDRCSGGSCCPAAGLTDRCTCDSPARADC